MDAEVANGQQLIEDQKESRNSDMAKGDERIATVDQEKGELQRRDDKVSPGDSEYDSAGSYSDEDENVKVRSKASDLDECSDSDQGGSMILKREEGDGQESVPNKAVDDDEDKKNPQYIPKRGTFYEHDDRTAEDESNERPEAEKEKENKKKVWQDKKEKWSHDKFNDVEQAPKTRSELIAIYGYDIRNEEGPPRARRRRRYGRGPNKYTRTWEDEAAYNKAPPVNKPKKQNKPRKNTEEFPPLVQNIEAPEAEASNQKDQTVMKSQEKTDDIKEMRDTQTPPELCQQQQQQLPQQSVQSHPQEGQSNKNAPQRTGSGRIINPKTPVKSFDYLGFTSKTRQYRNKKPDNPNQKVQYRDSSNNGVIHTQNFTNKNLKNTRVTELEKDMSKLSVEGGNKGNKFNNNQRQASVPPRLQSEQQKGSKRYSSMRQRSLPEANTPPAVPNYQHATTFYSSEYNQQAVPTTATQTSLIQQHRQGSSMHHSNAQMPQINPQSLPIPQQVPVTAAPIPIQFPVPPTAFPQAPPTAFLQPGVATPAFISPQTPGLINYVQGQAAFPANYQEFPQQFSPVTQPAELYQPQGGITYYSTDQQVQRPAPQKRPKAAIPIIAPPGENKKDNAEFIEERIESNELAAEVQQ